MNSGLRHSALVALLLWSLCAQAAVTAQLDRDQIQPGESVQLNLERQGSGGAEPDLSPLKKDFDVLGRSSGSSIQIINGSISRHKTVRVTLAPKRSGMLTIPALSWGGEQTEPLQLSVTAGGTQAQTHAGNTNSPHVFFTSTIDEAQPYVQSALLLTVRLHTDLPLQQASLDFSGNTDVLVQQIGQDQQSRETRDGHTFNVVERQYLLQPQRSGSLTLDGPTLNAEVADSSGGGPFGNDPFFSGMLGSTKPIRLHGKPIELDVRARPDAATGSDWLPARSLTLEHSLSPDSTQWHAGDPLTLHLRLRAAGLTGTQLPDLSSKLHLPDGIKAYPDQAKLDSSVVDGGIVGTRDQDIALIATQPGRYQLPELRVPWWDSKAGVQREIVLPAMSFEVTAASGAAATTKPSSATPVASPSLTRPADQPPGAALHIDGRRAMFWPWLSAALALLWLATLCAWWLHVRTLRNSAPAAKRSVPECKTAKAPNARHAFLRACRQNDALAAQRELLNWARQADPANPPSGLTAIAERLQQPNVTSLLLELDRACFAGGDWNGERLATTLRSLGERKKARAQKTSDLGPLYPS